VAQLPAYCGANIHRVGLAARLSTASGQCRH